MGAYLPGTGLGEKLQHRSVWSSYKGPIRVQVLGLEEGDSLLDGTCELIFSDDVVETLNVQLLQSATGGSKDLAQAVVGPFDVVGTYYVCFTLQTVSGFVLPIVVELPVVEL